LELDLEPLAEEPLVPEEMDLQVAYEDEHLLVVDKPAGLVVHPSAGQTGTLVHGLLSRGAAGGVAERPGIVHRLDRDTSGLLRVRLETGRTHQIRVHLEAIGLPVAGDAVYGAPGELGLERQFLHATRLAFTHPFSGERVDVTADLPPDLASALEKARLG